MSGPAGLTIGELMDAAKVPLDLRGYVLPLKSWSACSRSRLCDTGWRQNHVHRDAQGKNAGMILATVAMIALAVVAGLLGDLLLALF